MRLAEKAAKQYLELERLTYKLTRAFAPPHRKTGGKGKNAIIFLVNFPYNGN